MIIPPAPNTTLTHQFVRPLTKKGVCYDVQLKYVELKNLLQSFGFCRYDIDNTASVFVKIKDAVIEETNRKAIIDAFEDYIAGLPETIEDEDAVQIEKGMLTEKILRGIGGYFKEDFLHRLRYTSTIEFARDTKDEAFFYYRNGFVVCNKDGYSFKPYTELKGHIWKNQIIDRDFTPINLEEDLTNPDSPVVARFFGKICNDDSDRLLSLLSITGYLLHDFKETKLRAVALTDSTISEEAEGRTGKSLYGKILSKVRNMAEISGKEFRSDDSRKYQMCALDTQVIHINDLTYTFSLESIYTDITEGVKVDRKNEKPFMIYPKMLLSTNRTLKVSGSSDRDRVIEFEFSNYFSDKHSPEQEFKQWFFRDWDEKEWQKFDNFMVYCTVVYFIKGLVQAGTINLEHRKILDHTSPEFVEFMEDDNFLPVRGGLESTSYEKLEFETEYKIRSMFSRFLVLYPEYEIKLRQGKFFSEKRFHKWIDFYTDHHPNFAKLNKEKDKRKSGADRYLKFRKA